MLSKKRIEQLQELLRTLQVSAENYEVINLALTHPSMGTEKEENLVQGNNQRLEYLGDAVVGLVVGQFLYETYPDKPEGEMTKMRAALVCEGSLASVARRVSLGKYLLIGRGEQSCGGADRASNLADAWEALMAALYLEVGIEGVRGIILRYLEPELEQVRKGRYGDYKTQLQEIVQQKRTNTVSYAIIREEGPDHDKTFTACVYINDEVQAEGTGKTKKEAEQNAACQVLVQMGIIEQ